VNVCAVSEMGSELIQSNRKHAVLSVTSSSNDPLPDSRVLQDLKECCPDAVFFTLLPKLDEDETDTAEEDGTTNVVPLITSIGDEICSAAELRTDEEAIEIFT